uniref:Uncharacterized protein n=1 Tax=Arundo donax TaxID=35708 RepID=A0A0A9B8L6_ARUDO
MLFVNSFWSMSRHGTERQRCLHLLASTLG